MTVKSNAIPTGIKHGADEHTTSDGISLRFVTSKVVPKLPSAATLCYRLGRQDQRLSHVGPGSVLHYVPLG